MNIILHEKIKSDLIAKICNYSKCLFYNGERKKVYKKLHQHYDHLHIADLIRCEEFSYRVLV